MVVASSSCLYSALGVEGQEVKRTELQGQRNEIGKLTGR